MLNIAVCDDEKEIVVQICGLVKKYFSECEIKSYMSGIDLLSDIKNSNKYFDILFLDVQMEAINGIDTAKKIREYNSNNIIIFISAIKEYVFNAFDVNAFHYLLKPINEEKFKEVSERAIRELNTEKKHIFIKTRKKSVKLDIKEILYFENEMRKIAVHTKNEVIRYYGAMSAVEKQLDTAFFRCHRGYLVNMEHIEEYDSENILLDNGEKIYMAKDKYNEFIKCYMRFLRNEGNVYV